MRILGSIVLVIALLFWGAGLSTTIYRWLYGIGVIEEDYRYGDLYRLAPLPQFKLPTPECPQTNRSSDTASTHLYLIGDSFSEPQRLSQSDFRVSRYQRIAWDHSQTVKLDSSKRNVLLLESVERHVREHFARSVNELVVTADTSQSPGSSPSFWKTLYSDFHLTDVEERLESALFSQDWALRLKELKASLTLNWFDRAYSSVSLSNDKAHIFLRSDTDTTKAKQLNSSFSPLSDSEVNTLVDSINATANRYKEQGFDDVYLSLIPNKASVLEPDRGTYNHLIERIQNSPRLLVPVIDTYGAFRKNPSTSYLKSDTHWSCDGRATWLNLVQQKVGI